MRRQVTLATARSTNHGFLGVLAVAAATAILLAATPASADTYLVVMNGSGSWLQNGATYSGTFLAGMTGTWEIDLNDSLWPDASDSTARFNHIWDTYFAPNYDATPGAEAWYGYFDETTLPVAPRLEFNTTSPGGILAGDLDIVVLLRDYDADGILDQNEKHHNLQYSMTLEVDPIAGTGAFEAMSGSGSLSAGDFNFVNPPQTDTIQPAGQILLEPIPPPYLHVWVDVDCGISKAGDEVTYTVCVQNTGLVTVYNLVVFDHVNGEQSLLFPDVLLPGEEQCRGLSYVVQPGDADPLTIMVTADGESEIGIPAEDSDTAGVDLIHPGFTVSVECLTDPVPPGGSAEFSVEISNSGDCDLLIATDEPEIPPLTLGAGVMFPQVIMVPDPGGVEEICYEIDVSATIPPEYCELPNELLDSAMGCCPVESTSSTIYVPDDFATIGEALTAAQAGDTVILRADTYSEYSLIMKSGVTLLGETGDPSDVVIDGGYNETVMYCWSLSSGTEIRGITFTHGWAYGNGGGGLNCDGADVIVEDCVFYQNETYFGPGGGVAVVGGSPSFLGCVFEGNTTDDHGGGMYVSSASPAIHNCSFLSNSTSAYGGGLHLSAASSAIIGSTVFAGNSAHDGGGIFCTGDSDPTVESCTFYGNEAVEFAPAVMSVGNSFVDLSQSIVAGHTGNEPFFCDELPESGVSLGCCDVWGNSAGDYVGCIAGQNGVNGNFSDNPYFCDADAGDLSIHENSACADAPGCGVVGALGIGCGPHTIVVPTDEPVIQWGIDAAAPGDTVLILCGAYNEYGIVMKSGITLRSETGQPGCVTIDALTYGRIMTGTDLDPTTRIEGITFTYGYAADGGALHLDDSSPTIVSCAFTDNWAGDYEISDGGGAVMAVGGSPEFVDCQFTANQSETAGGAVLLDDSTPTFTSCWFVGNTATLAPGGAVSLVGASVATFSDAVFSGNWIGGTTGAAINATENSSLFIESTTFYGNDATGGNGSSIALSDSSHAVVNNTIMAFAPTGETVSCYGASDITLTCSDVYGNTEGDYVECLAGLNGVDGNFSLDPMFCDAPGGDLALNSGSPCADAPGCGLIGALGVGCAPTIWYVPDDALTIAAAIDSAVAGDTIIVRPGTYEESDLEMKSGVVLESETLNADDTIIDAVWTERVFICDGLSADTEIRGFTITNGFTYGGPGGGMSCIDSYLTVEDCFFFQNTTYMDDAGGVAVSGGEPTFLGCVFANNNAEVSGGGMKVSTSSPTITGCWFASNSAQSNGGGLLLDSSSPAITGCLFIGNDAYEGGAIYCAGDSDPTITNCTFNDNDADSFGPAMSLEGYAHADLINTIVANHSGSEPIICSGARGSVDLTCCDVYGNAGGNYSGCLAGQGVVNGNFSADPLYCSDGEATTFELSACSPCLVSGCGQVGALGQGCGGRIWIVPTEVPTIAAAIDSAAVCDTVFVLEGTYFEHNIDLKPYVTVMGDPAASEVIVDGEGISTVFTAYQADRVVLKNLIITRGYAAEGGAGLDASESFIDLYGVTFDSNNGGWGGAVACYGDSAHFTDCIFTDNTGDVGGGVYYEHWGPLRMTRCEFFGNDAPNNGGGLAVADGPCTLIDCSFVGNSADSGGGLIFGANEVMLSLLRCTFSGNHARYAAGGGGGLCTVAAGVSAPEVQMTECVFLDNTTEGRGAGAYFYVTTAAVSACTFHGNSAVGGGDAIECEEPGSTLVIDHTVISGGLSGPPVTCTGGGNVASVTCTDVYGNVGGNWFDCLAPFAPPSYGNFSSDPMYCDASSGDLHLDMSSPCVDAPGCGQVGALGVGCGIIWYVPDDAPTIAAGIDSAGAGDTVIVRPGTYYEHDLVMKQGVHLRSEFDDPDDVTIDAEGIGRVLYCNDLDSTTVIQGLTIAHGDTLYGSGMYCGTSSPQVIDCRFVDNVGEDGVGMNITSYCYPTLLRCEFLGNTASGVGAGIQCWLSSPEIIDCVFYDNQSEYSGGAIWVGDGSNVSITGSVFDENGASDGSALAVTSDLRSPGSVTVGNTIIAFGTDEGSAAYCAGSGSVTLTCCDVYGNAGGDYVDCLAGQDGSNGNISEDPLFCGSDNPDNPHTLKSTSPCAAENNPGCGQIGPYGIGCAGFVDWDAGGDGQTWEQPDNWNPDQVPGENDHARILLDGTYTVYYNSISDIWALTHGATTGTQTLDIETGVLAVTHGALNTQEIIVRDGATFDASVGRDTSVVVNEADATFTLDDGDLIGTGMFLNRGLLEKIGPATSHVTLTLENQEFARGGVGTVEAEAGTLSLDGETNTDGRLNVNSGATAIVSQHFVRGDRQSTGSLTNRGDVVVAPDGRLGADATLVIANEDGGVVTLNDGDLTGGGTFVNRGLVEKIGNGLSHVLLTFENLVEARGGVGTVEAEAGTLSFEGETNTDGRLNVNSGATAIVSQHFIRGQRDRTGSPAFDNDGEVTVAASGRFIVDPTGSVRSTGAFETTGRTVVESGATFNSSGDLTVQHGGALIARGQVTNEVGGDLFNNGLAHVPAGGVLVNAGYFDHRENGLLKGSGTVDNSGGVAAIKGLVAPGDSHGTLTYMGDFVQAPTSEISFEIGGYDQGVNYDLLDITGDATFKGAIDLSFTGGFVPVLNDSFQVIAHANRGGRTDFDCFAGLGVSDTLYMQPVQRLEEFLFRAVGGSTGNAVPVAADDAAAVTGYAPITIAVLDNDTDPDLDPLRVIVLNLELTEGIAYINEADSLVTYAAIPGFAGADSFDYVVTDCLGGSDTARVRIDVTAPPAVWEVPDDSPTIAGALALASPGDTVVVACGTYYESDIAVPSGVTLISETGEPDCVIIDATGRAGRGLIFSDLDGTTVVAGISVTGGTSEIGAGMYCNGAPTLIDCRFFANHALMGGGGAAIDYSSSPTFEGCSFEGNLSLIHI